MHGLHVKCPQDYPLEAMSGTRQAYMNFMCLKVLYHVFSKCQEKIFELLEHGGVLGVLMSFVKERISNRLPNIVFLIDIGNIL